MDRKIRISIIGSAGRKEDGKNFTYEKYIKMLIKAEEYILQILKINNIDFNNIELVSGGEPRSLDLEP